MKLLIDGVLFQFIDSHTALFWQSLLAALAGEPNTAMVVLDRGGCPPIAGAGIIKFPAMTWTSTAADSFLIEQIGRDIAADVFMSTYCTTPLTIPAVLIVDEITAITCAPAETDRIAKERQLARCFARYTHPMPGLAECSLPNGLAAQIRRLLQMAQDKRSTPANEAFFRAWQRLRTIQAEVDTSTIGPV